MKKLVALFLVAVISFGLVSTASAFGIQFRYEADDAIWMINDVAGAAELIQAYNGSPKIPLFVTNPKDANQTVKIVEYRNFSSEAKDSITSLELTDQINVCPNMYKAKNLRSITGMHGDWERIASISFSDCPKLVYAEFDGKKGMKVVEHSVFKNCPMLVSVNIPSTVTFIGSSAFFNCPKLSEFVFPVDLEIIESSAFSKCDLRTVSLGANLKEIYSYAFSHNKKLTDVYVYSTDVRYICRKGEDPFAGCDKEKLVLHASKGSTTEKFAKEFGYKFSDLMGGPQEPDDPPVTDTDFTDVKEGVWYTKDIKEAARLGIISGRGDGTFDPETNMTIAESIKIAATTYQTCVGGDMNDFKKSTPWYQTYVDFAKSKGFSGVSYNNYDAKITRRQNAEIMGNILDTFSSSELNKNTIEIGAIPDVANDPNVYALYRAGILVGYEDASFKPSTNIRRCEVAAIINRFVNPDARQSITLIKGDNDKTGFSPAAWSWVAQGEGYGRGTFKSGKYVRDDGNAVMYVESSDSYDFFSYIIYVKPTRVGLREYLTGNGGDTQYAYADTPGRTSGEDMYNMTFFDWMTTGIQVTTDWLDSNYDYYAAPDGFYKLVREKK